LPKITKRTANFVAKLLEEKKAKDILILDLRKITQISDFFIICTGNSKTHIKAISEYLREKLKEKKIKIYGEEGEKESGWILLDCGNIVIHIFQEEERKYYQLEKLWGDAKIIELSKT
jgi:ribosome-associated protein